MTENLIEDEKRSLKLHRDRLIDDRSRGTKYYHKLRKEIMIKIQQEVWSGWNTTLNEVGKIALVCIAKNEDDYIQEWIDYHFKLGVDEIFIYENDWRSDIIMDRVHTIPFDGKERQIFAYNDFIFTKSKQFDWVIFIDVDEFVVLHKHSNIQNFLKQYGNLPPSPRMDGIAINWMHFGDNNAPPKGSVLERFTRRGKYPDRHIKLIMRLNGDRIMLGPHHSYGFWMDTNGRIGSNQNNFDGPYDVIQLNHYFCKTKSEFESKMNRGRADCHVSKTMEDFESFNQNEIEDLTALNFFRNR